MTSPTAGACVVRIHLYHRRWQSWRLSHAGGDRRSQVVRTPSREVSCCWNEDASPLWGYFDGELPEIGGRDGLLIKDIPPDLFWEIIQ